MAYTCPRCGMNFRVVAAFPDAVEVSRCGESICRRRMATGDNDNKATVYVLARDILDG